MRVLAIAAIIALAMVAPLAAEPDQQLVIIEHQAYYDVDGITIDELRRQLDERRPQRDLTQWHALTVAELTTNLELASTSDHGCSFSLLEVNLDITIWLPRWRPREPVSQQLEQRWEPMLAGLRRHEEGHRRHALDAAHDLYRRLTALEPQSQCSEMESRARAEINRVMTRLQMKSSAYDALTGFGTRQGAEL